MMGWKRFLGIAVLTAVTALPAVPARAMLASNGMRVEPVGGVDFEVRFRAGESVQDYWCAAGDFAQRRLGARAVDRIFRVSPPPRRQGQGIVFSLSPDRSAGRTGMASFGGRDDGSLSVASAQGHCWREPRHSQW